MKEFVRDLIKYRSYIVYSGRADLKSEVTNAYLDWFWWILEPVCNMFIYYAIFGIVFHNTEPYYLVFIYSGITMWTFFNKMISQSLELIRSSRGIISRVYIPKTMLLMNKMYINGFKMFISCIIVIALMIPYKVHVDWHLIGLVPILLVFFLFTFGCSCIFMHFGVFVEDLSYIVSILLHVLFYFTGVFYSVAQKFPAPWGFFLENGNPVAFFIAQMRNALIYAQAISFRGTLLWLAVSVCITSLGIWTVNRYENSYVKVI